MSELFSDPVAAPLARCPLLAHAPVVGGAEATLSRQLGRGLRLSWPGATLDWLVLASAGAAPAPESTDWLLLETGDRLLHLSDGARVLAGLCGVHGPAGDEAWPSWLVGAIAGRLAGTPLAGLRAIRRGPAPGGGLAMLEWRLGEGTHAIDALAAASADTWCALLAGADCTPLRMPWREWSALAPQWSVLLATHRLPANVCATLASGDLILPDDACFDVGGHGRITLGGRRWQVAFAAPRHLQLLNEENRMHTDLTDDAPASGAQDGEQRPETCDDAGDGHVGAGVDGAAEPVAADQAMLGEVVLTLRFELGRTRLTLDGLRALGPRSVLELEGGAPRAIAVWCGASQVGRGEVVDVDGRLGVRLSHWGMAC